MVGEGLALTWGEEGVRWTVKRLRKGLRPGKRRERGTREEDRRGWCWKHVARGRRTDQRSGREGGAPPTPGALRKIGQGRRARRRGWGAVSTRALRAARAAAPSSACPSSRSPVLGQGSGSGAGAWDRRESLFQLGPQSGVFPGRRLEETRGVPHHQAGRSRGAGPGWDRAGHGVKAGG